MKTKLQTMLLAAAGVLGSVAVAHAQPAPSPAPDPAPAPAAAPAPPPPAPPPPAVDPNAPAVAPAAMPAAPAPGTWGAAPPPGAAAAPAPAPVPAPQEAPKKPNPFGFTQFSWSNSASTKSFGVGADYISSDDEVYMMDFGLNIRYTFLNQPKNKLFVNAAGGVEVELTNSDSTPKLRQPLLRDTSVGLGYTRRVFTSEDKETSTSAQLTTSASLPTSDLSRQQGKYLGTSVGLSVFHNQKLAGSKHDWFQSIFLIGSANWGHTFSRAYTPTSTDLAVTQRPRQVACDKDEGCQFDVSDQLSGYSLSHDTLRFTGGFYLSIYKDIIQLGNTWSITDRYKYAFSDTCVNLPTTEGCEPVGRLTNATKRGALTTFDVGISYYVPDNLGRVDFGYTNSTNQIGEDGLRRSVFYSPEAQFYMNLVANLDGIYDKAASGKAAGSRQRVGSLPRFSFQ